MNAEEPTERLIHYWRSGDRNAGDRLLRRYLPVLQSFFARRAAGNADDLVQRTLFACMQAVERFEGRSSFKSYLLGIAQKQFLMNLRSEAYSGYETVPLSTRPEDTPSQLIAFREEQLLVTKALLELNAEFMSALRLFYWSELSIDEIAAELQIPSGTVKSRLARGRAALKASVLRMNVEPALRSEALHELVYWLNSRCDY